MSVCTSFIPNLQPPEAVQPRMRALDDPTMPTESLLRLHPFASDARSNATLAQGGPVLLRIVSLVRMQLVGPFARPSSSTLDRMDRVYRGLQHRGLVDIGRRQQEFQRRALSIDHKMPLRA